METLERRRILIVDDEEADRMLLSAYLQRHGCQIFHAQDGLEGIEKARALQPDLILMDIQLPEISGLEVTKMLKADDSLKEIPVIAVTAFAMKGDEEKIREGGCEGYIAKPISVPTFLETVAKFLG